LLTAGIDFLDSDHIGRSGPSVLHVTLPLFDSADRASRLERRL
jgi:hypothetical protein